MRGRERGRREKKSHYSPNAQMLARAGAKAESGRQKNPTMSHMAGRDPAI